jgi:hypothetical protein
MNLICFAKPFVPKQILEAQRRLKVEIKDAVDPKGSNLHSPILLPMPSFFTFSMKGGE